mmetsp:Transcript_24455/g.54348  ORF Transcript_24455/g.54348 Transcript_24455/m.54348 type:complete len:227 (-) Transcript_24455:96-776(-)
MAQVPVLGQLTQQHGGVIPYHPGRYQELRRALVSHYAKQYVSGTLCWPRRFTSDQRALLPLTGSAVILQRMVQMNLTTLTHRPSGLRRKDVLGNYTIRIGDGLFSTIRYLPTNVIISFVGEEISCAEGLRRTEAGRGRYMIKLSVIADKVLDCYGAHSRGECLASYANSPKLCWDTATNRRAIKNCRLKVGLMRNGKWRAQLICTKTIEPEQEHLYDYLDEYVFDM